MRNNFVEKYFMHISFSFREKTMKSDQQEPPKCGSARGGGEAFLPHDWKTANTNMQ